MKGLIEGLIVGLVFVALGLLFAFGVKHDKGRNCGRAGCVSSATASSLPIFIGVFIMVLSVRDYRKKRTNPEPRQHFADYVNAVATPPHPGQHVADYVNPETTPPPELPPSKNPRYKRIDAFVSMADVPLDAPHYDYQRKMIAQHRRERGYPEEVEIKQS